MAYQLHESAVIELYAKSDELFGEILYHLSMLPHWSRFYHIHPDYIAAKFGISQESAGHVIVVWRQAGGDSLIERMRYDHEVIGENEEVIEA